MREKILSSYDGDDSDMDFALTRILDKCTKGNKEQTDRIFRTSDLLRDKWNKKDGYTTYGGRTIDNAMKRNREAGVYSTLPSVGKAQEPQGEEIETLPPVSDYSVLAMRDSYRETLENTPERIRTGFPYLDNLLDGGFYPSLIVLGAKPGQGKTAFGLQIMNAISRRGKDALIFALEMSRFELIERSISLRSFETDKDFAVTQAEIMMSESGKSKLNQQQRENLKRAEELFFDEYASHLYIREARGDMTTEKIRKILEAHSAQTGSVPVVMVDYIQLLKQPENIRHSMSDKQILDSNIMSLKQISRDFDTPVLAISSLNRATYRDPLSYDEAKVKTKAVKLESFKESGGIEYSADIVLGLNREGNGKKPRTMELDILKNRHGAEDSQSFDYYAEYNCFVDVNRGQKKS